MNRSEANLQWIPFNTLVRREVSRFLKVIVQTIISPMVSSTLYLLIFGVSLGATIPDTHGVNYLAFLIPGLVMMGCLNNAFQNSSSSIINMRFGGDLEDLKVVPLSRQQIIWALSLGGLIRGYSVGIVTWLVGELFFKVMNGEWLLAAHPLYLLFFLTVGGLAFAKIGIMVAFWARSFDQLSAASTFLLLPLIYLGGVFFSIQHLHIFWQKLAGLNPLLYFINGVRYGFIGVSDVNVHQAMTVSLVTLVIFHGCAVASLRRGNYSRW